MSRKAAIVVAAVASLAAPGVRAQSAADLSQRLSIDGRSADFTPVEAAFRNADVCPALPPPPCGPDEERATDSAWSALQDVGQIHVTWDAQFLYVAVDAVLGGHALWLGLDFQPGGLQGLGQLVAWRRALRFADDFRPDLFLAVHDAAAVPELYRATGAGAAVRLDAEEYRAAASFDADAPGRALEAAIPWVVLFPNAALAADPEPGSPVTPVFVLPAASSGQGLRLAAVVVHESEGLGGADVAPDAVGGVPLDPRLPLAVDRAVRVAWDANQTGAPHFVDFGVAVQTQVEARFVPAAPAPAVSLHIQNLRTFSGTTPSRLALADAGIDLTFAFDVDAPVPASVYLSAVIVSLRGEEVRELYRDARRRAGTPPPPFAPFGDAAADRWDGRDAGGLPVPGGIYVLRLTAGLAPGIAAVEVRRAVTVVR